MLQSASERAGQLFQPSTLCSNLLEYHQELNNLSTPKIRPGAGRGNAAYTEPQSQSLLAISNSANDMVAQIPPSVFTCFHKLSKNQKENL